MAAGDVDGGQQRQPGHESVSSQLASRAAPGSPDFSGWNWVAASAPCSTAAANGSPCSAQETKRPGPGELLGARRPQRVGVHEVEPGARGDPGEQPRARRRGHRVPAHVRQHARVEPLHRTRPGCAAVGPHAVFSRGDRPPGPPRFRTRREQHLHADADAEHRAAELEPPGDQLVTADRAQPGHAGREGAHPGHGQTVAVQRGVRVRSHLDPRAGPLQRALRRAQVP